MKFNSRQRVINGTLGLSFALGLSACSIIQPPRDSSTSDKINEQLRQASSQTGKTAAIPEAVSSSLLPPARPLLPKTSGKQLEQRFDLVVTDAPITQVLMGIVEGTRYSVMVKPKALINNRDLRTLPSPSSTTGQAASADVAATVQPMANLTERITVNLKNVTVFEALDSIREVYGYDYTLEGNRIYVSQPELQTRLYQVNYIIGQRRGVSDIQVIGGASVGRGGSSGTTTGSTTGAASGGASGFSSIQASALSTVAKSDVWGEVEDALRTVLGCQIPRLMQAGVGMASGSPTGTSGGASSGGSGSGSSSSSASTVAGVSNPGSRADVSYTGDVMQGDRVRGVDGCSDGRALSVSQMGGTIMVRGMPQEHRTIEKMLKSLQLSIERQVIIEAKVIEVELNAESQQGINWAGFNHGMHKLSVGSNPNNLFQPNSLYPLNPGARPGGLMGDSSWRTVDAAGNEIQTLGPATIGTALGTAMVGAAAGSAVTAGLGIALQFTNFSALINFLNTQGQTHVLSSPRIATLNNQKAVIKVGTEEPYVSSITPASNQTTGTGVVLQTVSNLNYQPFFSGISLDVTPKIDEKNNITLHVHALVNSITEKYKAAGTEVNANKVPFAINSINETDSVVKSKDGQIVVIGGLMLESTYDNRDKVPGAGDVSGLGAMFRKGVQQASKRELVILLKPTVVVDDSAWADDIAATAGRIESMKLPPLPQ